MRRPPRHCKSRYYWEWGGEFLRPTPVVCDPEETAEVRDPFGPQNGLRKGDRLKDLDRPLVRACLAGDRQAWEALIHRYERLLYSIPLRCGLTRDDADDVFQTVCVKLLENLDKLRDEAYLTGWLITTARRESWRVQRLRGRDAPFAEPEPGEAGESSLDSLADEDPLPQEEMIRLEEAQMVRVAMRELEERCRTLLELLYHADPELSYAEIAQRLNVSVGAIGPTRGRCLQKLRRVLERLGF